MIEKVAGESFAAKLSTHRPDPTRAAGLRARDKGHTMIQQTVKENKKGGINEDFKNKDEIKESKIIT